MAHIPLLNSIRLLFPFSLSLSFEGVGRIESIAFLELCINDHFDKGAKALVPMGTIFEIRVTAIVMKTSYPVIDVT